MQPSGSIRFEVIGEAFNQVKANMATWAITTLLMAIIGYAVMFLIMLPIQIVLRGIISSGSSGNFMVAMIVMMGGYFVAIAASMIVNGFLLAGIMRMALNQLKGLPVQVGDLFAAKDVAPQAIVASLVTSLLIGIGSMFCYIPGLILAGLFMLTIPIVVEQRLPAMDAIKKSVELMKPHLVMATLFYIVLAIVAGLGAIACIVGLLVTIPILFFGIAITYRDFCGLDGGTPAYGGGGPSPYPRDPNQAPPQ